MNPQQLILKCYAENESGNWVAVCIDLNLAAQGQTFEETKVKLEAMIDEYIHDALVGEDKAFAAQLLSRKAPLSLRLRYWSIRFKNALSYNADKIFNEVMPLKPA